MQNTKNQQETAKFRHRRFILSGAALFLGTVMLAAFFTAPASLASGDGGGDGGERDGKRKRRKKKSKKRKGWFKKKSKKKASSKKKKGWLKKIFKSE